MKIPLEDAFSDIIGKAQRGLRISDSELAQKAGVSAADIEPLHRGVLDEATLAKVAVVLELDPATLIDLGLRRWYPNVPLLPRSFRQFTTPYEEMTVNAYLVWDAATGSAFAFDTGADCSEMLHTIREARLKLEAVFLSHTHYDHVADLDKLVSATRAKVYVSEHERMSRAEPAPEGAQFSVGGLAISARHTPGHSAGGMTYVIEGLERRLAIVGDALFAGSIGGANTAWNEARSNIWVKILSLPDDTIVCPGHGPLTTVGEEKDHNPFFARPVD